MPQGDPTVFHGRRIGNGGKRLVLEPSLSFAIPIAFLDIIEAPVGLRLAPDVCRTRRIMAPAEQRARKLCATILSVHVVVGIDELASFDAVAHRLAVCDSINKPKGQIISSLCSTHQI